MAVSVPLTRQHDWVRHSVENVSVIVDPFTGHCSAVSDPEGSIGEQVGCACCGEPLTDASSLTACAGEDLWP